VDQAAKGFAGAIAHIVEQNPYYVGCTGRRFGWFRPPLFGFSECSADYALIGLCRLRMQGYIRTGRKNQR
jgi:hypothetical protein